MALSLKSVIGLQAGIELIATLQPHRQRIEDDARAQSESMTPSGMDRDSFL
jgi:hypothetical protein